MRDLAIARAIVNNNNNNRLGRLVGYMFMALDRHLWLRHFAFSVQYSYPK